MKSIKIYENGLEEEESVEQLQITLSGVESHLKIRIKIKIFGLSNVKYNSWH